MTSANFSDEPIIYQDHDPALQTLSDGILSHNRRINIFTDDSVAQVFENKPYMVRRSRGFVPLPIKLNYNIDSTILAVGPLLKTTFAFIYNGMATLGHYIGNTDSPAAIDAERKAIKHFMKLFSIKPDIVAIDKHPGYPNRSLAEDFPKAKVVEIQHHKAHIASLMAENNERDDILGIAMDGTGYGDDGNIWGGEFFTGNYQELHRFGHLKYQYLPSGDKSAKEPWRYALSILYTLYKEKDIVSEFAESFGERGLQVLELIRNNQQGISTSSCGRLFDAVASLCNLGHLNTYEGELPSLLQGQAEGIFPKKQAYQFSIEKNQNLHVLNFLPIIHDIIKDKDQLPEKSYKFHLTLATSFNKMAEIARDELNIHKVGLSGGVFQNILLLQLTRDMLTENGFKVITHSQIPPNDGGVSLGQALLAAYI